MAKAKRRSPKIARKHRPTGFVSQNASACAQSNETASPPEERIDHAADRSPEFGSGEPNPALGFVPQYATSGERQRDRAATNRANAAKSTGPRTPEGKAASSQNALKHGLSLQRHAILPDENPAVYNQLLSELREIYEPLSRREDLAVEDIAQCRWAIQRCDEAEATFLTRLTNEANDPTLGLEDGILSPGQALGYAACVLIETGHRNRRYVEPDADYPALQKIHRYRTTWDRRLQRALSELDRGERARHAEARHQLQQDDAVRKAELHHLRLAQAQAKLAREEAKTLEHQARAAARKSKADEDSLFDAVERILNATPSDFRNWPANKPNGHSNPEHANGFVPQNPTTTEETLQTAHAN